MRDANARRRLAPTEEVLGGLAAHYTGLAEEQSELGLEGYARLTTAAPLPITGGEVLTRRQAFRPWLERRAVDIIQPDATKCGGLSEARRIAWKPSTSPAL